MIHDLVINSTALSAYGGWLTSVPPTISTKERGEWVELLGRTGDRFVSDGAYESADVQLEVHLEDADNINAVSDLVHNMTTMRITPDAFYYNASCKNIDVSWSEWEDIPDNGVDLTLTVHVQPWKYIWPATGIMTLATSGRITNKYGESRPLIFIYSADAANDAVVTIGSYTVTVSGYAGWVGIDSESKVVRNADGTAWLGQYVKLSGPNGDRWPVLGSGTTYYSCNDYVSNLQIMPRWRKL